MALDLFDYQKEGANFLAQKKCAMLSFTMGLGKTATAIRACDLVEAKSILVISPAIARINWSREFEKFSDVERNFKVIETRKQAEIAQFNNEKFCIVSYDLASNHSETLKRKWDVLILDEHHYLKNKTAKRTQEILGGQGIVRHSNYIWALSGTPAPNHAGELWPILYTFGATKLKYNDFIERYCDFYETTYGRQITGTKISSIPELKNSLQTIMLRRNKEDVALQLPSLFYGTITVPSGPVDLDIAAGLVHWVYPNDNRIAFFEKIEESKKLMELYFKNKPTQLDTISFLISSANSLSTYRMYCGLQKVKSTIDLVKEEFSLGLYDKLVIFCIHVDVIKLLQAGLEEFSPLVLYGNTNPQMRQINIDKFQTHKKYKIMICNILAAGTAVTLTAANNVLFVEQDWVPGNNAQAAMRVHRIGQTKPVSVRFLALEDSIDQKITGILQRKAKELTELLDTDRNTKTIAKTENSIIKTRRKHHANDDNSEQP